jgi:hypothetical protein
MGQRQDFDGDGWDEVFRAGTHRDSAGNEHRFTDADIARIAERYTPSYHEAPVVVGHPADTAPAYGWVEAAKAVGGKLYLKYKQVAPEFVEWVRKGRYKKRSISLYPDMSLRHVGFLGAQPPALKGLPDFAFADHGAPLVFNYSEDALKRVFTRIREVLIEKFGLDSADRAIPAYEIEMLGDRPEASDDTTYTEGDPMGKSAREIELEEQLAAEKQTNATLSTQYSEALGRVTALTAENTRLTAEKQQTAFAAFAERMVDEKRIAPAQRGAVVAFMETLAKSGEIDFSETDGVRVRKSALDTFRSFCESLPATSGVSFGEHATHGSATPPAGIGSGTAADRLDAIARQKIAAGQGVSYGIAFAEAQRENPELASEYAIEVRG